MATILNFEATLVARDLSHGAAQACLSLRACIEDDPGIEDSEAAAAAISACDDLGDHFVHPHAAMLTPGEAHAAGVLIRDYLSGRTPVGEATAALATVWDRLSA